MAEDKDEHNNIDIQRLSLDTISDETLNELFDALQLEAPPDPPPPDPAATACGAPCRWPPRQGLPCRWSSSSCPYLTHALWRISEDRDSPVESCPQHPRILFCRCKQCS
jgi:hypothetical protein